MDLMGTWDAAIAATFSGGVVAAIAKAYISKTVSNLETVLEKVQEIKTDIAKLSVKMDHTGELVDDTASLVSKHDRKIAAMEAKIYGNQRSGRAPSCPSD